MKISETIKDKVIELYCKSGKRISTILREVAPNGEITIEELYDILNEYKEYNPDKLKRKEKKTVSADDVLELLEEGLNHKQIENKLGVSKGTVSKRMNLLKERGIDIPKAPTVTDTKRIEENIKILDLLKNGLSQVEVAKRLSLSCKTISSRVKQMREQGIDVPQYKRSKDDNEEVKDEEIAILVQQGLTRKEVGEKLGLPYNVISNRIAKMRRKGIDIPKRNHTKKIENDDVDNEILKLLEKGLNQTEIAKMYGVKRASISARVAEMRKRGEVIPDKVKEKSIEIDKKIIELKKDGLTQAEVAKKLNISSSTIVNRVKKMRKRGIEVPKPKHYRYSKSFEKQNEILELLKKGVTKNEISNRLGLAPITVSRRIKKMKNQGVIIIKGKQIRKKRKTENDEIDNIILEGLKKSLPKKEIAKQVNLSYNAVWHRVKNMEKRGVEMRSSSNDKEVSKPAKEKIVKETKSYKKNVKILELLEQGLNQTEIEEKIGIKQCSISLRIKKMKEQGIEIPEKKKARKKRKIINDDRDNEILELLQTGLNQHEIGERLGVKDSTISGRIKNMRERGIDIPKKKRFNKKKNDNKDNTILELLEKGYTQEEMGEKLGITHSSVSHRIVHMKKRGVVIPSNKEAKKARKLSKKNNDNMIEAPDVDIAKGIVNLINSKNATIEQVRIMAKQYGVEQNVEELIKELDEKER